MNFRYLISKYCNIFSWNIFKMPKKIQTNSMPSNYFVLVSPVVLVGGFLFPAALMVRIFCCLVKSLKCKIKVKFQWPEAPQWRICYRFSWGQLSTTYSSDTEVSKWAAPSYSRPQPATGNDVKDGICN